MQKANIELKNINLYIDISFSPYLRVSLGASKRKYKVVSLIHFLFCLFHESALATNKVFKHILD